MLQDLLIHLRNPIAALIHEKIISCFSSLNTKRTAAERSLPRMTSVKELAEGDKGKELAVVVERSLPRMTSVKELTLEDLKSQFGYTRKEAEQNLKAAGGYICQFWAPVGGRRLLSTSGQPFAVGGYLSNEFVMYRQYSSSSENHMDVIGGTFLNRLSCVNQLPSEVVHTGLHVSITLPICLRGFSSPTTCIGVLECTSAANSVAQLVLDVIVNLKEAGLDVFPVQDLIPYKTINGLKLAKDEIDNALKVVCRSHNLALAQVWIACEDKRFSSCMKETRRLLPFKLTGCVFDARYRIFHSLCDVFPSILARTTLQDYTSRFFSEPRCDLLIGLDGSFLPESVAATICWKSNDTGDFDYAFEFIWSKGLNFPISLVGVVSTLKRCLPRFKFASGEQEQVREELPVLVVGRGMTWFSARKRSSEENLHGSEISRKIRKVNDSSINKSEKDNGAIQDPSTKTLILEADYGYGIIKFHLPILQATHANVEKEISKKLKLSVGTYRLEYLDEEEDWICLDTDEEMGDCITSSRKIAEYIGEEEMRGCLRIQLRVTLSHKSVIGPFEILSIE